MSADLVVASLARALVVLLTTLIGVLYMALFFERKVVAWAQSRLGPMRVGPYGTLQPIADVLKLMVKEDITPSRADRRMFAAAPILAVVPALVAYAVIPFSADFWVADINVGILYIVATASIGVYGVILAGWSSNSKYPLLAGLRASAQLISYEIAAGLAIVSMVLTSGTLSLIGIVHAQADAKLWFGFVQPVALAIFVIAGLAEANRLPFDMAEAEQELTGGFHTEYSGMRMALFLLAEYASMITVALVATTMFFGGWLRPFPSVEWLGFLDAMPGWMWLLLKTFCLLFGFVWIRATLPRYRYDQLMRISWKALIPLAIVNILMTATIKVAV